MFACNTIYTYKKHVIYIFGLAKSKNKIFYLILVVKQLPSWSFETVSPSWLHFEGGGTKLSSSMSFSFSSLTETSSLSGQYSTSDPQSKLSLSLSWSVKIASIVSPTEKKASCLYCHMKPVRVFPLLRRLWLGTLCK